MPADKQRDISWPIGSYIYVSCWSGKLLRHPNNKDYCHHQKKNKFPLLRRYFFGFRTQRNQAVTELKASFQLDNIYSAARKCYPGCWERKISSLNQLGILHVMLPVCQARHAHWCNSGITVKMETNLFLIGSEAHSI